VNSDGFKPNLETHLVPLLATKREEATMNSDDKSSSSTKVAHHPLLLQVPLNPTPSVSGFVPP
jgi:aspartyl aminopeptidase